MEESSGVHSQENRVSAGKTIKRTLKTPGQVIALENFYNEHKYPSEEMKALIADQIGLTEKQISSWFCHRRLKDKRGVRDEVNTNGRQDRSSGINQDRGSGLLQDSCGSTKQGDCRNTDAREVESERLYGHDFPTADSTSRYTGNLCGIDNSSSKNGSSLQDTSQKEDQYNGETYKYTTENGASTSFIPKGTNSMGYKPSGYLKRKGEVENTAITAVKRQLGRNYREDGPLLGVQFEELPPGAFALPSRDPVNGPIYVGDLSRIRCPDVSGSQKHSSLSTRYDVYNKKMCSQDSYMENVNCNPEHDFDSHDEYFHLQLKRKPIDDYSNSNTEETSALDGSDDLLGKASTFSQRRSCMMNSKHHIDRIKSDSVTNYHDTSGRKVSSEQKDDFFLDDDNGSSKIVQGNDYMSRPSHPKFASGKYLNTEEKSLLLKMKKEEGQYGEMKETKKSDYPVRRKRHSANEMTVAKGYRVEFQQQQFVTKESFTKLPLKRNLVVREAI